MLKRWQEYTEELHRKDFHDPDNRNGVITHLETDILECKVKWALGSINTKKASGGDEIPVELFQILKNDAMKVLHSICQHIWKTQQWPQKWKSSVAHQALPSMVFSRQECWSELPFPSPGDLPDLGIECGSPSLEADSLLSEPLKTIIRLTSLE